MRPLARYTSLLLLLFHLSIHAQDGSLDTSFGNGGKVTTSINGKDCGAHAIALQNDGKIVAVGNSSSQHAYIRYLPDGRRDASFGTDGIVIGSIDRTPGLALSVLIQPDGKILTGGVNYVVNDWLASVVRFNSDGTLDSTFNQSGRLLMPSWLSNSRIYDMALQKDNKIVVTGYTINNMNSDAFVARLTPDGQLDLNFGVNGIQIISVTPTSIESCSNILIEPDQKIVIAGVTHDSNNFDILLARLMPDGSYDENFGNNGISQINLPGNYDDRVSDILRFADGKFLVAGTYTTFSSSPMLARFHNNGSIDSTFGFNGVFVKEQENFLDLNAYQSVGIQADGRIITAGYKESFDTVYFEVSRFTANGKIDSTFGNNGIVLTSFNGSNDQWALSSVIQPDGKIVVAGFDLNPPKKIALARYNAGKTVSTGKPIPVSDGLKVYPNPCPANGSLVIQHPALKENGTIEIRSWNGTTLAAYATKAGAAETSIKVPDLIPGTYLVRIQTAGKHIPGTLFTVH